MVKKQDKRSVLTTSMREMSETAVRPWQKPALRYGRTVVSGIKMVSTDLLSCFFTILYHLQEDEVEKRFKGGSHRLPPQIEGCLSKNWMWWQSVGTKAWIVSVLHVGYLIPILHPFPAAQSPCYEMKKLLKKCVLKVVKV